MRLVGEAVRTAEPGRAEFLLDAVGEDELLTSADGAAGPRAPETLRFAIGECSLGRVLVAGSGNGVRAILIGDGREALLADLGSRFRNAELREDVSTGAITACALTK